MANELTIAVDEKYTVNGKVKTRNVEMYTGILIWNSADASGASVYGDRVVMGTIGLASNGIPTGKVYHYTPTGWVDTGQIVEGLYGL